VAAALNVVSHADEFAVAGVGENMNRSPEVQAFAVLLDQPDATPLFESLLSDATPEGQMYALCGLWLTDLAAYQAAETRFAESSTVVTYQYGCILHRLAASTLIQSPQSEAEGCIRSGELPLQLLAYVEGGT